MGSQSFVYTGLAIIMIILPLNFNAVGHVYVCYQLILPNQEGPYFSVVELALAGVMSHQLLLKYASLGH